MGQFEFFDRDNMGQNSNCPISTGNLMSATTLCQRKFLTRNKGGNGCHKSEGRLGPLALSP